MQRWELLQIGAALNGLFFFFALGATIGSFINVLAYRWPRGEGLINPPSACPHCGTRLRWNDNIPILGWLILRGRCRYCRSRISPQYPLVELATALLFAAPWVLWFLDPIAAEFVGISGETRQTIAPEWTNQRGISRLGETWLILTVILGLLGCLAAATAVDAKTFQIPLALCWIMAALGIVGHTAGALIHGEPTWSAHAWAIPTPTGPLLGAALAGALGVALASALLKWGVIPRSFADYDEWEKAAMSAHSQAQAATNPTISTTNQAQTATLRSLLVRTTLLTGPAVAGMFAGFTIAQPLGLALEGMAIGTTAGLVVGVILRNLAAKGEIQDAIKHATDHSPHLDDAARAHDPDRTDAGNAPPAHGSGAFDGGVAWWLEYPHARREMAKELLFIAPIAAFAALGWWLGSAGGPLRNALGGAVLDDGAVAGGPPLWLTVLGGTLLGYLVGGGAVWLVRILGTLAFGKEAMGLGDVHLMAGVGACLGWIDPTLAFFVAPFFAIAWAIAAVALSRVVGKVGPALPYGPHLAAATVAVLLAKPLFEAGLSFLMAEPVDLP